jgi:hypothetical protein
LSDVLAHGIWITAMSDEQQKAVDEILARFPGPASIFPNRLRLFFDLMITLVILPALLFASFGFIPMKFWILNIDGLIVTFLVLLWIGGLLRMLLANKPILILDQKGMTSNRVVGRQQIADWKDVESCRIDEVPLGINVSIVARDRSPHRWGDHKLIKVSWYIEINYDPLVRLLTQWRERALQAKG